MLRRLLVLLALCLFAGLLPRSTEANEVHIPLKWADIGIVTKSARIPDSYSLLWIFTVSIVVVTYFNNSVQFWSVQDGA